MNNKKSLISKLLIGGGLLALICGIFCFFGSAFSMSFNDAVPGLGDAGMSMTLSSLFSFMFGSTATATISATVGSESESYSESGPVNSVGGTTALFAIEMIIIVLAVILLVGIFTKKLQKKHITIGCGIVCVLAIVTVILAFCSKKMVANSFIKSLSEEATIEQLEQMGIKFSLGSAGISYGVLGIVGILATGAGLFLGKDETAVAA